MAVDLTPQRPAPPLPLRPNIIDPESSASPRPPTRVREAPVIGYCANTSGEIRQYLWNSVEAAISEVRSGLTAKLLLCESPSGADTKALLKSYFDVPESLLSTHSRDNICRLDKGIFDKRALFAKWLRPVSQSKKLWRIEQRIEAGEPYDIPSFADPKVLRLDHTRYERCSSPYRPYDAIDEATFGETIGQAAKQCISVLAVTKTDSPMYLILFDSPRRIQAKRVKYNFLGSEEIPESPRTLETFDPGQSCRARFIDQLDRHTIFSSQPKAPQRDLFEQIQRVILCFVLEDETTVLDQFSQTLDEIELSLDKDSILRDALSKWREYFGRWRNRLFHQTASLEYLTTFVDSKNHSHPTGPATNTKNANSAMLEKLEDQSAQMNLLCKENEVLRCRLDGMYNSLMSSMSIVESKRAIAQAEEVSELTSLAFLFVPLTLLASLFGMNLADFQNQLTIPLWVIVSISVTLATYSLRYWRNLLSFPRHVLVYTRSQRFRRILMLFMFMPLYWLIGMAKGTVERPLLVAFCIITLFTGVGVEIWFVVSKQGTTVVINFMIAAAICSGLAGVILGSAGIMIRRYHTRQKRD